MQNDKYNERLSLNWFVPVPTKKELALPYHFQEHPGTIPLFQTKCKAWNKTTASIGGNRYYHFVSNGNVGNVYPIFSTYCAKVTNNRKMEINLLWLETQSKQPPLLKLSWQGHQHLKLQLVLQVMVEPERNLNLQK